ncbi:hypothetical protein [Methanoculleus sp. UBA303]|jgi:hypothetical protein|uniref:hypothetical protein n=1 Tax=Methanoculleus sp. UBA303 TaxID=1915497 RepID=UPI0025CF6BFF|nr:hypothetical protein [Methanoculleus sp. UBA303]MDD3933302.1 hypothetical protein [Methanoculleus sp.]
MDLSKRAALGFALVVLLLGGFFAVQITAEEWLTLNPPDRMTPVIDSRETVSFGKSDFNYLSWKYRPYKEPLLIATGGDQKDSPWYLMFVNTNVTPPYGGNPKLGRTGYVRVDYDLHDLAGTAAFHVLALTGSSWRTNRIEGFGSSALFVRGDAEPGTSMGPTTEMTDYNNIQVLPAGVRENPEDTAPYSYYIHFDPASGGLNSLHITRDLSRVKGEIIDTTDQSGSFNLTSSGGPAIDALLLLVAVDEMQPDTFSLSLDMQFIRSEG